MLGAVFDLFAGINRTLDSAQGGLGIGLSLVKRRWLACKVAPLGSPAEASNRAAPSPRFCRLSQVWRQSCRHFWHHLQKPLKLLKLPGLPKPGLSVTGFWWSMTTSMPLGPWPCCWVYLALKHLKAGYFNPAAARRAAALSVR